MKYVSKFNPFVFLLIAVCIFAASLAAGFLLNRSRVAPGREASGSYSAAVPTQWAQNDDALAVRPTIIPPDFSANPVVPRTVFNTASWKEYKDAGIGFAFRYPPEWGNPSVKSEVCQPGICSNDGSAAFSFRLSFPNAKFTVGGASRNYFPARGNNILHDFAGDRLSYNGKVPDAWSRDVICTTPWFINCQRIGNIVHYTTLPSCSGEPGSGFGYERVMLVYVPGGAKVNGLAFGGEFVPAGHTVSDDRRCNDTVRKSIADALLKRKIDPEIIQSFDLYEKVFETVSVL